MINNPGAFPGHATLLPSAQQVPAAELDNGDTCKGAFRGPHQQHPLLFRQPWPRLFLWVLFSSGIASYTPQKSVSGYDCISLSLLGFLRKFLLTPRVYILKYFLSGWFIFLHLCKVRSRWGFWKPVPLRFNLMHLGHKFLFHEAGCISPVSKPQFLHP